MKGAFTLTYGTRFHFTSQMRRPPCIKGEEFAVENVRAGDEHILEGLYHQYKKFRHLVSSRSPSSPAPVKSEISEVLNAIAMMGQNLQRF